MKTEPNAWRGEDESSGRNHRHRLSRRDLLVLGAVAGGGALASSWLQNTAPLARDVSNNLAAREALALTSSRYDGNSAGDVRLVAFNDFLCPICKLTAPDLATAVRDDGRVRIEYIDLAVFGPVAEKAARLGLAVALQDKYSQYHHALMDARRPIDQALLRQAVEGVDASWTQAELDLRTYERKFTAQLNEDAMLAFKLGINGTPAFLIGGLLAIGRLDQAQFKTLFAQARDLS